MRAVVNLHVLQDIADTSQELFYLGTVKGLIGGWFIIDYCSWLMQSNSRVTVFLTAFKDCLWPEIMLSCIR